MSLFISSAHAQAAGQATQGGEMFQILFLVGLFVLFYFGHQNTEGKIPTGSEIFEK